MKTKLSQMTVAVQGSGWGWLGYNKATDALQLATCANQDPLEATTGLIPLFGIDVLGARLLPRLQERAARLRERHLGHRQLERCCPAVRRGESKRPV